MKGCEVIVEMSLAAELCSKSIGKAMEVKEKVREFIQKNIIDADSEPQFSDDDNLFQLGFVNSLFAKKLVIYVEEDFGVVVSNEDFDISNFNSVKNIVNFIEKGKNKPEWATTTHKREI
jgi:methoxymalonate biosynthesis acyl carrier protein